MANKRISYKEYKRRVFNSILTECFVKMHAMVNGLDESCAFMSMYGREYMRDLVQDRNAPALRASARSLAENFFKEEMEFDKRTINETKAKLKDTTSFVKDCVTLAEAIAEEKAEIASEEELELTDDDKGDEIGYEEKSEINKLFDKKAPTITADVVAKASVDALIEEKKKAEEIKDAVSLAKAAGDSKKFEETVNKIGSRGVTSLMNGIMTCVTESVLKQENEYSESMSTSYIMSENADKIRTNSTLIYTLYETMNAFGFKQYSKDDIKRISNYFFYRKI